NALNFSGPGGTAQMQAPQYSIRPNGNGIVPGNFTVDNGTGTPAVGAFQATLTMPAGITWTNREAMMAPDRSQDLTVTWSGGSADKEVVLIVGASGSDLATGGFLCTEKVSAGKFTVPAWVMTNMPQTDMVVD